MPSDKPPRPAYVVDVDEASGKAVHGSRRSASTKDPKDKPKISHRDSRSGKPTRKSVSDTGPTDSSSADAQAVALVRDEREAKLERRKSISGSTKSPRKSGRPPSAHENRPKITIPTREDPTHYGVTTPTSARSMPVASQPIPMRPRAITAQTYGGRPSSLHQAYLPNGGYYPPPAVSSFYQQPQLITPSYPPPSPSYLHYATTSQPGPSQQDYFTQHKHITAPPRPLSARFDMPPRSQQPAIDPITRTASAFGSRPRQAFEDTYNAAYYEDSYSSRESGGLEKRASIRGSSGISKADADAITMPPPPRPGILRKPTIDYAVSAFDRDYRDARPRYIDEPRPRRPSTNRNSVSYDLSHDSERVRIETANNGRRRQSYYDQSSTESSGYEDKLHQAASYQEDVANIAGPSVPLTADLLRRQQKRHGGSSRSTKSSGSRDESDYRKSATTRTTRSGSGNDDENVTIKVTGQARVVVGGAQIDCNQGGEIQIMRQQKSIRNGSEASRSEYGGTQARIDDRRSRIDAPTGRSRISSQHSYTRVARPAQYQDFI